jgi:hypothetical protein
VWRLPCGLPDGGKIPAQIPGQLAEVTPELQPYLQLQPYDAVCNWAGPDRARLRVVQQTRDYRPEWVDHEFERQSTRQHKEGES